MNTPPTPTPEQLDTATIDLVFALRDSLTDTGPSYIDFWAGRAASAIETAAAAAPTWGQAVTTAARKLQINVLTTDASEAVTRHQQLIDAHYELWAGHVARNIVYIIALASMLRPTRTKSKKVTTPAIPALNEKAPF